MSRVVSDDVINNDQTGRASGEFKDGTQIRKVEIQSDNTIIFKSQQGETLYTERAVPKDFFIRTINADHSAFTGTVVLVLGGFTPDTGNSRVITIATDYKIAAAIEYGAPNNTVDDVP